MDLLQEVSWFWRRGQGRYLKGKGKGAECPAVCRGDSGTVNSRLADTGGR